MAFMKGSATTSGGDTLGFRYQATNAVGTFRRFKLGSAAFLAVALLGGCGGSADSVSPVAPTSTPTATPSPQPTATPSPQPTPSPLTLRQIFRRPVLSRAYEQDQWVLRQSSGNGDRETAATVGAALAALKPSYVSGLIYLQNGTTLTPGMIADYGSIRTAVQAQNPDARFDVEISINPNPPAPNAPFASAAALVDMMRAVDAQLHPDGWWFDFYSVAQKSHPDWIAAAATYAHEHSQTIGGNVFDSTVPPGSDAIAFVDDVVSGSQYGFDFDRGQVAKLTAAAGSTIILGHLQSNPQNGSTTESCIYPQQWSEGQRASYLKYFASQQSAVGFTFMYPGFYPLCPGAFAYDPLQDPASGGGTLYDYLKVLVAQYNP